jgi:hypothetical protein
MHTQAKAIGALITAAFTLGMCVGFVLARA